MIRDRLPAKGTETGNPGGDSRSELVSGVWDSAGTRAGNDQRIQGAGDGKKSSINIIGV